MPPPLSGDILRHSAPIRAYPLIRVAPLPLQAFIRGRVKLGVGDAVLHDLRRTFATWHGEIGTQPEILTALLNHAPTTMTGKVYNRATNLEPKRRAMERWCDWLALVTTGRFDAAQQMQGAEVVELRERSVRAGGAHVEV